LNGVRIVERSRFLVLLWALVAWSFTARAADEAALLGLWERHTEKPDDHPAMLKACGEFATAHADDPLLPVVRGIEAWHLMRTGRRTDALKMMTVDLSAPASPVNEGARRIAQGWLTRADRDDVAAALQTYYRKHVAYPKSLDQLPVEGRPPLNDRFGKPWNYQLTGFAKLKGFADQKYSLLSPFLGDTSDFKAALKLAGGARISAEPMQLVAGPANTAAVKFKLPQGETVIGIGQAANDLYLAFVGTRIVIVCDYTHWKILPRP
jgi:hypothetical protein